MDAGQVACFPTCIFHNIYLLTRGMYVINNVSRREDHPPSILLNLHPVRCRLSFSLDVSLPNYCLFLQSPPLFHHSFLSFFSCCPSPTDNISCEALPAIALSWRQQAGELRDYFLFGSHVTRLVLDDARGLFK